MIPVTAATVVSENRDSKFNRTYIFAISLTAALGGLMFGYDWVVIGGAELFYEKYFHLTSAVQVGWAMSSALIGALFGAMFGGALSDKFGRKPLLIASGLLFVVTSIGTGMAPTFLLFVINRVFGGVAIGIASNLSSLYIAEVAPASMRGRLVSINQLTIASGVMLAQIVNWIIARPMPRGNDGIPDPAGLLECSIRMAMDVRRYGGSRPYFSLSMMFAPESPRWLAKKKRTDRSIKVLTKMAAMSYAVRTVKEIESTFSAGGWGFPSEGVADAENAQDINAGSSACRVPAMVRNQRYLSIRIAHLCGCWLCREWHFVFDHRDRCGGSRDDIPGYRNGGPLGASRIDARRCVWSDGHLLCHWMGLPQPCDRHYPGDPCGCGNRLLLLLASPCDVGNFVGDISKSHSWCSDVHLRGCVVAGKFFALSDFPDHV